MKHAVFLLALGLAAAVPLPAQDVVVLGKQRAAGSKLAWQIGEGAHPTLGPIRFAGLERPVVTPVGDKNVYSLVFFSCERNSTSIAIEFANATAPNDPAGLHPKAQPRLICHKPGPGGRMVQNDVQARWGVTQIGDAMARGIRPAELRQCAGIGVVQELVLPKGWPRETARVEFEIPPYGRELDAIFYTCGEMSAYATTAMTTAGAPSPTAKPPSPPPTAVAAAPAPTKAPAPPPPPPPPATSTGEWKTARTLAQGRTNLRAGPGLNNPIVAELPPDVTVLVQPTGTDWWKAKSPGPRASFEGYIRQDRLVFK